MKKLEAVELVRELVKALDCAINFTHDCLADDMHKANKKALTKAKQWLVENDDR